VIDLLTQILCWIKQIGALVLNALIDVLNLAIVGVADAIVAFIAAWPIDMPDLPTAPSELSTVWGWVMWSPLPVEAGIAFFLFSVSVWVLWLAASILLRWLKVIS
jgi:hypothetical protein